MMMTVWQPKKMQHVKYMLRLRHLRGITKRNNKLRFDNSFGIQIIKTKNNKHLKQNKRNLGLFLKEKVLETIRLFIARYITNNKLTKISKTYFRVKLTRSKTGRSAEKPMGGGKSKVIGFVRPAKSGTILFECVIPLEHAKILSNRLLYILPFKAKILYNYSNNNEK